MKKIITLFAFLFSLQCYSQITASLTYSRSENIVELIVKNTSSDKEVIILDNARSSARGGSKVNFYYGPSKDKYLLTLDWWVGLNQEAGLINLKPLEERRFKYNKAVKFTDRDDLKVMKVQFNIAYYVSNEPNPNVQRCKGEKVFTIN